MPTCCVVIEGVFESEPAGDVIFHDATGIDENAIAEVPKTIQREVTGSGATSLRPRFPTKQNQDE